MTEAADYDGAWKEALEQYLRPFLEFCFPTVAGGIDWTVPVEFLDQELQEVVRDADLGKQWADKLIKVQRQDGLEEWVLIHVEVQSQPELELPQRMYQYHHRISDRFGRRVVSLAVLADERDGWRPGYYQEELWGCRMHFEFRRELIQFEQEKVMPYITSIERFGRQEGRQETLHEVILDVLEARFGAVPYELRGRILAVADETDLKRFHRQAALVESLERFAQEL